MSTQIFGKYEVIRRLALGGMGEVFLARQTGVAVDRLVILKSLLPELAEQDGFIEQFLDEARVAATLNHPNIVAIYEVGLWNGVYFIAMEYIHGSDLSKLQRAAAKQRVVLPFQVSARVIHDSCLGLDHAHFAKDVNNNPLSIVHRDVSPQNIMVRTDGVSKVVDFGIAMAANRSTRTATGLLKGKLQYMPPEQVQGKDLDGRSDQFALGVVLWEMTTGQRLFKGENDLQTLEKILKDPVPPPSSIVSGFPRDLEAVVMRMLQRDPAYRYDRCSDAARDIKTYLESSSRHVGEQQVAKFVADAMGDELEKVTSDLTPAQDNFLIRLGRHDEDGLEEVQSFTPTTSRSIVTELPKSAGPLAWIAGAAAAVMLVGVCAVALVLLVGDDDRNGNVVSAAQAQPLPQATFTDGALVVPGPPGAKIYLDGELRDEVAPAEIKGLPPGTHSIMLEVDGVKQRAQSVRVEAGRPILVVESSPSGAMVFLGNNPVGATPRRIDSLPPGDYQIKLVKRGYQNKLEAVVLKPGKTSTLKFKLTAKRGRSTPRTDPRTKPKVVTKDTRPGFVTLNSSPWAKISVDGRPFGSTPIFKKPLPPGRHKVRLVNEENEISVIKTITVEPGKVTKRNWKLK